METIKFYEGNLINARDLHKLLKSKRDFSNWIQYRIKQYNFVENEDFSLLNKIVEQKSQTKKRGGSNKIEYLLTLNMAKELSMIENTDEGRKARKYFIECEIKLKAIYNKRIEAFKELSESKSKLMSFVQDKGLNELDFIEIDKAGSKALFNGKDMNDENLQTVLLKARSLATEITHYNSFSDDLSSLEEIKEENCKNHTEVRHTLLTRKIKPETLQPNEKIKN